LFNTGHNRKTDARDAHCIAIVAVRTTTLRVLTADGELEARRMLCDRRAELTRLRVQAVNRVNRLLAELVPGQARVGGARASCLAACLPPSGTPSPSTAEPFEYPRSEWPASIVMVGPCDWDPPLEPRSWLEQVTGPIVLVTTS